MGPYLIDGSLFIQTDVTYWGIFLATLVEGKGGGSLPVGEQSVWEKLPHLMPKVVAYTLSDALRAPWRYAEDTRGLVPLLVIAGGLGKEATDNHLLDKYQPLTGTGYSTCILVYSPSQACLSYPVLYGFPPSERFQFSSWCFTGARKPGHRSLFAAKCIPSRRHAPAFVTWHLLARSLSQLP